MEKAVEGRALESRWKTVPSVYEDTTPLFRGAGTRTTAATGTAARRACIPLSV